MGAAGLVGPGAGQEYNTVPGPRPVGVLLV
jgi:hypothetical protein